MIDERDHVLHYAGKSSLGAAILMTLAAVVLATLLPMKAQAQSPHAFNAGQACTSACVADEEKRMP